MNRTEDTKKLEIDSDGAGIDQSKLTIKVNGSDKDYNISYTDSVDLSKVNLTYGNPEITENPPSGIKTNYRSKSGTFGYDENNKVAVKTQYHEDWVTEDITVLQACGAKLEAARKTKASNNSDTNVKNSYISYNGFMSAMALTLYNISSESSTIPQGETYGTDWVNFEIHD